MPLKLLSLLFLGGGFGTVARFATNRAALSAGMSAFAATAIVNIVGSAAFGFLAVRLEKEGVLPAVVLTGFLGGYTTFSAFSWETLDSMKSGTMTGLVSALLVATVAIVSCYLGAKAAGA